MNTAYRLEHVSFCYPEQQTLAVDCIDAIIPLGSSTAVIGPNGAGKSTLMDLLLRWKRATSGRVMLMDQPIESYSKRELGRLISLVPQEETARFSFTVLDYVLFGRSAYLMPTAAPSTKDIEIALEALQRTGIGYLAHRSITQVSGGEQQLVLLSRSLAQRPKILLLDEPTSSLDPGNTDRVVTILRQLKHSGITMLFTTHDPNLASDLADHIIMLKSGSVLFSGQTEDALQASHLSELYTTNMIVTKIDDKPYVARKLTAH